MDNKNELIQLLKSIHLVYTDAWFNPKFGVQILESNENEDEYFICKSECREVEMNTAALFTFANFLSDQQSHLVFCIVRCLQLARHFRFTNMVDLDLTICDHRGDNPERRDIPLILIAALRYYAKYRDHNFPSDGAYSSHISALADFIIEQRFEHNGVSPNQSY